MTAAPTTKATPAAKAGVWLGSSDEYTVVSIAIPNAAPSVDDILIIPDATPTFSAGTLVKAVSSTGVAKKPSPKPMNKKPITDTMIYTISGRNAV